MKIYAAYDHEAHIAELDRYVGKGLWVSARGDFLSIFDNDMWIMLTSSFEDNGEILYTLHYVSKACRIGYFTDRAAIAKMLMANEYVACPQMISIDHPIEVLTTDELIDSLRIQED